MVPQGCYAREEEAVALVAHLARADEGQQGGGNRKNEAGHRQGQDGVRYVPLPLTKTGKDTKPG